MAKSQNGYFTAMLEAKKNNLQSFDQDLSPQDYLNIATNSKIMLCPAGFLHNTSYRYFESLYCKNITIYPKNDFCSIFFEKQNKILKKTG